MIETELHTLALWIRLQAWTVNAEMVGQLREVIQRFPGNCPILLEVCSYDGEPSRLVLGGEWRVSVGPGVWNALADVPAVEHATLAGMARKDAGAP